MTVNTLEIRDFRNIKDLRMLPGDGVNIICGDNAQGKTNILEAIWLFSGAKSFRGARDQDLIRFQSEGASLHLDFCAQKREQQADIRYGKEKRAVLLNDIAESNPGAFMGTFCTVLFSPDHLFLVKRGPEYRRKMLDVSLSQALPKYAKVLEGYNRILKQRAVLLRDAGKHSQVLDILDVWDESLADYGSYIAGVRAGYVRQLGLLAGEIYSGITYGEEKLEALYSPGFSVRDNLKTRQEFRESLKESLRESRSDDIRLMKTTVGPHRDDMDLLINGVPARYFASQGQQRSCILALKLAECGILEERNQEPPVILLDDVMSELDEKRRGWLLNELTGKQIFITCCDISLFKNMEKGSVFFIEAGGLADRKV